MVAKYSIKAAASYVSAGRACFPLKAPEGQACIFNYHRVTNLGCVDLAADSWSVSPQRFEKHARWLAESAECVPLEDLMRRFKTTPRRKPLVALTFDDGFANFHGHALPILKRFAIPATLFVPTKYVGSAMPYPFDRWGGRNASRALDSAWRPITWPELEECLESGLVSVGSHSHSHLHATDCTDNVLWEEVMTSTDVLRRNLGPQHAVLYSYPYGLSRHGDVRPAYVEAVRAAGYRVAVSSNLGLVSSEADIFALPRVEVTAHDSAGALHAKASGWLAPTLFLDRLRRPRVRSETSSG